MTECGFVLCISDNAAALLLNIIIIIYTIGLGRYGTRVFPYNILYIIIIIVTAVSVGAVD